MSVPYNISIIPVLLFANTLTPSVKYWWSKESAPPYRRGKKGVDWAGPFEKQGDCIHHVAQTLKRLTGLDKVEIAYRFAEGIQVTSPGFATRLTVEFELPLDEYSELIFMSKLLSPERRQFEEALDIDVDLYNILDEPQLLVTKVEDYKLELRAASIEGYKAIFQVPVDVYYRNTADLGVSVLAFLQAFVSVKDLYPDVKARLHTESAIAI